MLNEEYVNNLVDVLVRRIERVNTYTIKRIAEVLNELRDIPPSRAYDLAMILKYGGDFDKIVKELAKVTDLNEKEILEIFEQVAKKNLVFAKQFYEYRDMKYIPYEKNIALQEQVRAIAKITQDTYRNMSNSLGFVRIKNGRKVFTPLAKTYQEVIDEGATALIQGKDSFNSALRNIVKELSKSGLKTIDWESGYHRRLDSSVRMNLRGALRDYSIQLQEQFGEQFKADGVEVSVHDNPAPDHAHVQGHQFSKEEFEKFQNDIDCKDYKGNVFTAEYKGHDRRSIGQLNCYHYIYNIVLGVSKPQYNDKQLQDIIDENEKGFMLDGKHYTNYEGTQLQRKLETAIRKQKDRKIMAKTTGEKDEELLAEQKITELTNKYFELSQKSGLPTKLDRLHMR